MIPIRNVAAALVAAAGLATGAAASAQAVMQSVQQQLALAAQLAAQNRTALSAYTWVETTQVSVKGEVKDTTVESCRYGPDGQVQRTQLSDDSAAMPPGLRGLIAKKKAEATAASLRSAAALAHQYVPLDPARIQAVISVGGASLGQAGPGTAQLRFANYVQQGDLVTLTVDTQARLLDQIDVATWMDQPATTVSLDVDLDSLPDGTRFPATTTLLVPSAGIQVQIRNSNYQKLAQ